LIMLILLGLHPIAIIIAILVFSFYPILDSWLVAKRIEREG